MINKIVWNAGIATLFFVGVGFGYWATLWAQDHGLIRAFGHRPALISSAHTDSPPVTIAQTLEQREAAAAPYWFKPARLAAEPLAPGASHDPPKKRHGEQPKMPPLGSGPYGVPADSVPEWKGAFEQWWCRSHECAR